MAVVVRFLFVLVGYQSLRGENHASYAGGVLKGGTGDLGRVDYALRHHVAVVVGLGVIAEVGGAVVAHLLQNHRGFVPRVGGDDPDGHLQSLPEDGCADGFVFAQFQAIER